MRTIACFAMIIIGEDVGNKMSYCALIEFGLGVGSAAVVARAAKLMSGLIKLYIISHGHYFFLRLLT